MASRVHIIVKKPFDQYPEAGLRAVLSSSGVSRIEGGKKRDLIEVEAEELENGCLVVHGKTLSLADSRKCFGLDGKLVDGFMAIVDAASAAPNRADTKPLRTRG